jgi:hypothetical protein
MVRIRSLHYCLSPFLTASATYGVLGGLITPRMRSLGMHGHFSRFWLFDCLFILCPVVLERDGMVGLRHKVFLKGHSSWRKKK